MGDEKATPRSGLRGCSGESGICGVTSQGRCPGQLRITPALSVGFWSECAGICVDRILGDVVDYAVLGGRYLLRLCVRAGIMAGECASVAEHVVLLSA